MECNDQLYFGRSGYWFKLKVGDCQVWIVNPETGYFIGSEYWDMLNNIIHIYNYSTPMFTHRPYLTEILNNLTTVGIMRTGNRNSPNIMSIKHLRVLMQTTVNIHDIICTIIFITKKITVDLDDITNERNLIIEELTTRKYLEIPNYRYEDYCNPVLLLSGKQFHIYDDIFRGTKLAVEIKKNNKKGSDKKGSDKK
jgi:hypothetical protein